MRREMSPAGDLAGLVHALLAEGRRRVMVVGHEPDLSALVASLLGPPFARGFDKPMVVGAQLRPRDAKEARQAGSGGARTRLPFALDPKTLRLHPAAPRPPSAPHASFHTPPARP